MSDPTAAQMAQVRPKLKLVAPLTSAICWGYVWVNLLLGAGMFFLYQGEIPPPISVASILNYREWGILFFVLGLIGGYALVANRWTLTRRLLLAGLFIKAVWAVALIFRSIQNPQTILITAVWLFFAYIQAITYVHFMPVSDRRSTDAPRLG